MVRAASTTSEDLSSDEDAYVHGTSSDKENATGRNLKGKGREMVYPATGLGDGEDEPDRDAYDPDQNPEERRKVRKEYRDLTRRLQDSKQEYLQPHSEGLRNTFLQAEDLFKKVKQTSDATLDSRLLVAASDLALKKATNLTFGCSDIGLDIDEFVGKCIAFMRHSARQHRPVNEEEDDDAMDFAYLGRAAAFHSNKRPATCDFLLGPLSVVKRNRTQKVRRQKLKRNEKEVVRPQEMKGDDVQKHENKTLKLVRSLHGILMNVFGEDESSMEEGLNLFRFVVNPESFGQTVENIFYLSFLVKEGHVSIQEKDELPMIFLAEPPAEGDHAKMNITRSQIIFPMTMWHWKECIDVFNIETSMIPTREKEPETIGANGWYT
ncbi:hypothetical protein RUND412_009138 [Rhizina undulata]